jgi:uncharacterized protein (DUF58 family)
MTRLWRMRLSREGVYYCLVVLAVLSGAVGRQLNLLMLVGSVLAGPFLFSLIYGRLALRRLAVERKLPTHLHAAERLAVDVSVTNHRRWLGVWGVEVQDVVRREEASGLAEQVSAAVFFTHVASGETSQVRYAGRLPRRGRYRFGPLRLVSRFPLGLVRHSRTVPDTSTLIVHPKLGRLTQNWAHIARENASGGQRMQRRGLLEGEFHGLRDWRAGDSRRWIHWRTSARRGVLVVRQFERRRSEDLAVLVDLWQPQDPSEAERENVETAVSFVASVIAEACGQLGRQLVLSVAAEQSLHHSGPASPMFFREQMDALSLVAPHGLAEFPRSLGRSLAMVPDSMSTLVVSTRRIDWQSLRAAASENDARIDGRAVQGVEVTSPLFGRYFQA